MPSAIRLRFCVILEGFAPGKRAAFCPPSSSTRFEGSNDSPVAHAGSAITHALNRSRSEPTPPVTRVGTDASISASRDNATSKKRFCRESYQNRCVRANADEGGLRRTNTSRAWISVQPFREFRSVDAGFHAETSLLNRLRRVCWQDDTEGTALKRVVGQLSRATLWTTTDNEYAAAECAAFAEPACWQEPRAGPRFSLEDRLALFVG